MAVKRRSVAPETTTITALEMAKRGQYRTYNLTDPEHGMKYYDPNDPNMHEKCLYRSDRIAVNKSDKQDHFTDKHAL